MVLDSMSWLTSEERVSMEEADVDTLMDSVTAPISRVRLSSRLWLVVRIKLERTSFLKPGFSTVRV